MAQVNREDRQKYIVANIMEKALAISEAHMIDLSSSGDIDVASQYFANGVNNLLRHGMKIADINRMDVKDFLGRLGDYGEFCIERVIVVKTPDMLSIDIRMLCIEPDLVSDYDDDDDLDDLNDLDD